MSKKKDNELDWLYDYVVSFLKSPPWTVPINTFIDENCVIFDTEDENKFEYTEIHKKFISLVEELLTKNLSEIGVTEEQFAAACEKGKHQQLNKLVFEQLMAVDDFSTFKKMMVKRNMELELEALKVLQRAERHLQQKSATPLPSSSRATAAPVAAVVSSAGGKTQAKMMDTSELPEDVQLEMAIQLSRNPDFANLQQTADDELGEAIRASLIASEMYQKQLQREQADLEHAMAMSMALEQERLKVMKAQEEEEARKKNASKSTPSGTDADSAKPASAATTKAVTATAAAPVSKASPKIVSDDAAVTKASISSPSSAASRPAAIAHTSAQPSSSSANSSPGSVARTATILPPLKGRRPSTELTRQALSAKAEEFLLAKRNEAAAAAASSSSSPASSSSGVNSSLSAEELERRKAFLKAQKEKIIAMKNKERGADLQKYHDEQKKVSATANTSSTNSALPADDDVEKKRDAYRLVLAKRLKWEMYETEKKRLESAVAEKFSLLQEQLKKVEQVQDDELLNAIKQQQRMLEADKKRLEELNRMHEGMAASKVDAKAAEFQM